MQKYLDRTLEFLKNEKGASAAEYALLIGLIAMVIMAGISAFGTSLGSYYQSLAGSLPF